MEPMTPSPGLVPPRPAGCQSCAAAEAQVDRLNQEVTRLNGELDHEKARADYYATRAEAALTRLAAGNRLLEACIPLLIDTDQDELVEKIGLHTDNVTPVVARIAGPDTMEEAQGDR